MSTCRQQDNTDGWVGAYFAGARGNAAVYEPEIRGEADWNYSGEISIAQAYVKEHADLIASIRAGKPLNEAQQVAESTLTAILGRESAYTGKHLSWDEVLNSDLDLSPPKHEFGPVPLRPVPQPGKFR
jgi:hypothetical protein